jgi:hypothetical protein
VFRAGVPRTVVVVVAEVPRFARDDHPATPGAKDAARLHLSVPLLAKTLMVGSIAALRWCRPQAVLLALAVLVALA